MRDVVIFGMGQIAEVIHHYLTEEGGRNVIRVGDTTVPLGIRDRVQERDKAAEMIPLGRWGTAEEAAGGVFLLCSPWSNYIHGQVLHVTGGLLAGMSG